MQSIYLSNTSTRDIDLSTLEKYLSKHPEIKLKNYVLQFFYSEGRDSFIKHDQYFISNLGVFIYKNNYNKNALKLFMEDLLSGKDLKELLLSKNTRGQFCLIIYYQNKLKLITDIFLVWLLMFIIGIMQKLVHSSLLEDFLKNL